MRSTRSMLISLYVILSFGAAAAANPAQAQTCQPVNALGVVCDAPIYGTVYWPDGTPARSVQLALMPDGPTDLVSWASPSMPEIDMRTNADGTYQTAGCPCFGLMGFIVMGAEIPECEMILAAYTPSMTKDEFKDNLLSLKGLKGIAAQPGDEVDWVVYPVRCGSELNVSPESITRNWLGNLNRDPKTCQSSCTPQEPHFTWQEMRAYLAQHPDK